MLEEWSDGTESDRRSFTLLHQSNTPILHSEVVVPAGNAPASSAYRAEALLLSYGTVVICGFKPKRTGRKTKFSFDGRIRMTRVGL